MQNYDNVVSKLSYRHLLCGFVSGKKELQNWGSSDLFQFYLDTVSFKGSIDILESLCKSASFIVQAVYYDVSGRYIKQKSELLFELPKEEKGVLQAYIELKNKKDIDRHNFNLLSEKLLLWSSYLMEKYS